MFFFRALVNPLDLFYVESPNTVHQADLLFLPHDKLSKALIPKVQTESAKKEHLILEPGLSMTCHCV